jgi:hypothetical protein
MPTLAGKMSTTAALPLADRVRLRPKSPQRRVPPRTHGALRINPSIGAEPMTRHQHLCSYLRQLKLTYRDSHNVDDRRELRAQMAKVREEIDQELIKKLDLYAAGKPTVSIS